MKSLDATPVKINEKQKRIADLLMSLHITKSPFTKVPSYHYEDLNKGITCEKCDSFSVEVEGKKCKCRKCEHKESVSSAVLRAVKEYQILFSEQKITTNLIYDWCQVVPTKKWIRQILKKNYNLVGVHQWAYFE